MRRQILRPIALGAFALVAFGAAPVAAEPNPLAELLRKVDAKEADNGFCNKLNWASGDDRRRYVRWLDAAVEGSAKVNRLKAGKQCQYDEVTRISTEQGRKCVHYTWHACLTDSVCGSGSDIECKQANGDWKRK